MPISWYHIRGTYYLGIVLCSHLFLELKKNVQLHVIAEAEEL